MNNSIMMAVHSRSQRVICEPLMNNSIMMAVHSRSQRERGDKLPSMNDSLSWWSLITGHSESEVTCYPLMNDTIMMAAHSRSQQERGGMLTSYERLSIMMAAHNRSQREWGGMVTSHERHYHDGHSKQVTARARWHVNLLWTTFYHGDRWHQVTVWEVIC